MVASGKRGGDAAGVLFKNAVPGVDCLKSRRADDRSDRLETVDRVRRVIGGHFCLFSRRYVVLRHYSVGGGGGGYLQLMLKV